MRLRISLVAFLLFPSLSLAAELRTLAGATIAGDLVSLDAKGITIKTATDQIMMPLDQVLDVELNKVGSAAGMARYTEVELTDGTLLRCSQVVIKGQQAELSIPGINEPIKVPLEVISLIQKDAHDDKVRQNWKERFLNKKRNRDLVVFKRGKGEKESLEGLEGTVNAADEEGKRIEFVSARGDKLNLPLNRVQGMIFLRTPNPNTEPVICKLFDRQSNLLMASSLIRDDKGITVTTPAGVKVAYPLDLVARLDFSKGKLTYLSDDAFWKSGKVTVIQSSTDGFIEKPRRDKNLDNHPIRMGGRPYTRGLSVHSRTELEFQLDGEYREFKAVIGMDDQVGGDGPTVVRIEGDGRELLALNVTRKDHPRPVTLNIKDVQKLKLVVDTGDLLDLGKHVNFADAKVSK